MTDLARANLVQGAWRAAAAGRVFRAPGADGAQGAWPLSGAEDVAEAWREARAAGAGWRGIERSERVERLQRAARSLAEDEPLRAALGARFGLAPADFSAAGRDLERALLETIAPAAGPSSAAPGEDRAVAWLVPDWSELLRAPFLDLARELVAGRVAVLLSDARVPELAERLGAAVGAEVPPGVLGLVHGATRELTALALAGGADAQLVASGRAERMVELRRLCEQHGLGEPRLRALRCGVFEVAAEGDLEACAAEVEARAFGARETLGGQLPGTLARVFCPARRFARFTELLLERLAVRPAGPPLVDEEAALRVRSAWELGLDEGATCIAGGDGEGLALPPTVFTNVESSMESARRQDPLPVLCLLRVS